MTAALGDLTSLPTPVLLASYAAVMAELRRRGTVHTENNPCADLAERLVAAALGLTEATNNAKGWDATDAVGCRYQVKGRRVTPQNPSEQLGVIRDLLADGDGPFDYLAAVLFAPDFHVQRAVLAPISVVRRIARWSKRQSAHFALVRDLDGDDVLDITMECRAAYEAV